MTHLDTTNAADTLAAPTAPHATDQEAAQPRSTDQIGAWLDRLLRLTRLPKPEADELREELDAHLRERVRDLMLVGHDEPDAIHKSISELGDLAQLAQRYREASRTPRRRLVMNIAIIAVASSALGLSTLALQQSQPENPPATLDQNTAAGLSRLGLVPVEVGPDGQGTYELSLLSPNETAPEGRRIPILSDVPVLSTFFTPQVESSVPFEGDISAAELSAVLSMLADSQGLRAYIHWRDIDLEPETELSNLPFSGQSLDRIMNMLNDALDLDGMGTIDFRIENGLLEFASREYFDLRERELITYDVSTLVYADNPLQSASETGMETLMELIVTMAEPEVWPEQGGRVATAFAAGDKLLVNAPPRVHERITWLLTQLQQDESAAAEPSGDAVTINVMPLESIAAEQLEPTLTRAVAELGGQVIADNRSNSLLVSGDEAVHSLAAYFIKTLDVPVDELSLRDGDALSPATPE